MPNINLTINAESAQELMVILANIALAGKTITLKEQVLTPVADHVQPTTDAKLDKALDKAIDEVERSEKPKRGRPAKATTQTPEPAPTPVPVAEPAPVAPAPVTPPQVQETLFNEAKQALADFVANDEKAGREKAIGMLKSLGVARLTELDVSGLQKFLALVKS